MERLFVFGTLRPDVGNSQAGRFGLREIRPASLPGYDLYSLGWFPGIVPGKGTVSGWLMEVAGEFLPLLDQYEGTSRGLNERVVVALDDETTAWVYRLQQAAVPLAHEELISGGDWKLKGAV